MSTSQDEVLAIAQVRADMASGRARIIRERARLSQSEMARAVGVHWTTVAHWESGRRVPRGPTAAQYAEMLRQLDKMTQASQPPSPAR